MEEAGLVAGAQGGLAQAAEEELRVADEDEPVQRAGGPGRPHRKFLRRLEGHARPARRPGAHQNSDQLLARPPFDGLQHGRQGQVHPLRCVAGVAGQLGGAVPGEPGVPGGEQEGGRQEVLGRRDQDLPVFGGGQVGGDAHQAGRLRPGLLRLGDVQVHFVAIKVGVVGRAHALVEAKGAPGHDAGGVGHDGLAVQGGLAVEEDGVPVVQVALHHVARAQLGRDAAAVAVLQEPAPAVREAHKVGARPAAHAGEDAGAQVGQVVRGDAGRVGQGHGDGAGDAHLADAQVGVGRDDGAGGKVDALARQVAPEPALLALEALHKAAQGLGGGLVG